MEEKLNEIEKDFIEFVSIKKKRPHETTKRIFLETRDYFKFTMPTYGKKVGGFRRLHRIIYHPTDEAGAIEAYQFYGLLHLFRYLSYSYPKTFSVYFYEFFNLLKKYQFKKIFVFAKRLIARKLKTYFSTTSSEQAGLAETLIAKTNGRPVVVDYGSGLAYISFEIAKLDKNSKIYLLDIPTLSLEFAEFRFKKNGFDIEIIPVTKNDPYPKLPKHNICIATETMEHVPKPLIAYQNIYDALEIGGVLYGNFEDHEKGTFHPSWKLHDLRERISLEFEQIGYRLYKKIK